MATSLLSPNAKQQFFDNAGQPAAGFKLYTYAANTLTPQATYSNRAGTIANPNPIILDARGEAVIYLPPGVVYDYVLTSPADVPVWTREDIEADALATDLSSGDSGKGAALVTYKATGTGAIPRSLLSKLDEFRSVLDFIPPAEHAAIRARTSTYDCTAAFQAGTTAARRLFVPEGTYLFSGVVNVPEENEIVGAGWYATRLTRAGTDQSYFKLGSAAAIREMGFTPSDGSTPTSGRLIDTSDTGGCVVSGVWAYACWDGIYSTNSSALYLDRLYLNRWQNSAVHLNTAVIDVMLSHFVFYNPGTVGHGVRLYNGVEALTMTNGDVIGGEHGLSTGSDTYTVGSRLFPCFNFISNCYFDNATGGVLLEYCEQIAFTNCWFSNRPGDGVVLGPCYGISFENCTASFCGSNGYNVSVDTAKFVTFNNCRAIANNGSGAGGHGFAFAAGVSDFTVMGCVASNAGIPLAQQQYGIYIAPGAGDRFVVQGNHLTGNATLSMQDNATGASKRVGGNVGYVPPIIAPTLINGWVNFGGAYQAAGYWKDSDGVVHLTGVVKSGSAGTTIFVLPAGYRPAASELFTYVAGGALGYGEVQATGNVVFSAGATSDVSISGVSFLAQQ